MLYLLATCAIFASKKSIPLSAAQKEELAFSGCKFLKQKGCVYWFI
jgi:hypothetical protein